MPVLKAGSKLQSAVSTVEVIITRGPGDERNLSCGGVAMVEPGSSPALRDDLEGGVLVGKRYVDSSGQLELLCTKAGRGELSLDGELLVVRDSKPLPSSD